MQNLKLDYCRCGHQELKHTAYRGHCAVVVAWYGWDEWTQSEESRTCDCQGYEPRALLRREIRVASHKSLVLGGIYASTFILAACVILGIISKLI